MDVDVGGTVHWLWRAVDDYGVVFDVFLQWHRHPEAATFSSARLLGKHDVPVAIDSNKLWIYGTALRELPALHAVGHVQGVTAAHCNNVVEQYT